MATIRRLEGATPYEGGALIVFPSNLGKELAWRVRAPIRPTLDFAKAQAAAVLDELMRSGHNDDAERTNWPSLVAGLQRIVDDFNQLLEAHCKNQTKH